MTFTILTNVPETGAAKESQVINDSPIANTNQNHNDKMPITFGWFPMLGVIMYLAGCVENCFTHHDGSPE